MKASSALIAVLCGVSLSSHALAIDYTFTAIAGNGMYGISGFSQIGGITNSGDVIFNAGVVNSNGSYYQGILSGNGSGVTTLISNANTYSAGGYNFTFDWTLCCGSLGVSSNGNVAFSSQYTASNANSSYSSHGVFAINADNTLTPIATNTPLTPIPAGSPSNNDPFMPSQASTYQSASGVSINNSGQVAFIGTTGNWVNNVFVFDGSQTKQITDATDWYNGLWSNSGTTAINNSGQVAFSASNIHSGQFISAGGYVANIESGQITEVATENYAQIKAINDLSAIAYSANMDVYTYDANSNIQNHPYDGYTPFYGGVGGIDINNAGQTVMYIQNYNDGSRGIWMATDDGLQSIIKDGDALFGDTVGYVDFFGNNPLNDNGQIVFGVSLRNGGFQIVRADPVLPPSTVPTPPAFILMLTGLGLLGLTKRFRKAV